jgi:Flp pilus assembly pilin Flp
MNRMRKGKHGQAMTEYIIIVAIIALAALAVFGLFGDRIRAMVGGAVTDLGGTVDTELDTKSTDYLKTLGTGTTP